MPNFSEATLTATQLTIDPSLRRLHDARMALPSEEVVAILAPIIVYWVAAGVYTVLGRVLADHRLHSREEEEVRNLVPKRVVVRTVLLQHVLQAAIAFAVFNVSAGVPHSSMLATQVAVQLN